MRAFFCLLAILYAFTAVAQDQRENKNDRPIIHVPSNFITGERFIDLSEVDRALYAMGLMDGFLASAVFGANEAQISSLASCTKDMDAKQVAAIITKYVKDHPESWHQPLGILAYNAMHNACPGGLRIKD